MIERREDHAALGFYWGAGVGSEVLVSRQYGGAQGYIDLYIIGIVDMISEG